MANVHFTGRQWAFIQPFLPPPARTGRPRAEDRRTVERTFAWLGQYRRLSKDYERLCATTEALIHSAMSRLILRRPTRP